MAIKQHTIPFQIGGPIQASAKFAGRRDILQNIATAMKNLQNISLRGERRTGKTSLLLYLAHPDSAQELRLLETQVEYGLARR